MSGNPVRFFSPDIKMQHYKSLDNLSLTDSWVTIGSFDGVHRGHQVIFKSLAQKAHENGANAVVITFFPHPTIVLQGIQSAYYLTDPDEKARLMGEFGIDQVITLPFTLEFAAQPAEQFITKLVKHLGMRQIWAGIDFAMGRNREGNVEMLKNLGAKMGFEVQIIAQITDEGKRISSTHIRQQISEGRVAEAAELLGRLYSLNGKVVEGDKRGKTIGFPTANLKIWLGYLVPRNGVYATWVKFDNNRFPSVTNIGLRPTFEDQPTVPRIEAHLIDFTGDIYSKQIQLEFIEFIRTEKRFSSIDELKEQINNDIKIALEVFKDVQ